MLESKPTTGVNSCCFSIHGSLSCVCDCLEWSDSNAIEDERVTLLESGSCISVVLISSIWWQCFVVDV